MGNILIEGAIDGLRLIGIDVPPSAENFIEMLVNAGVDVVSEVPRIISFIEQLGAEAWSTIEQVATGMEQYGPVGYIEHLIDQAFEPHYQTIKNIHEQKKLMLDAHRTNLANFQTQVQALSTGSQSFTGLAATSSNDKLTTLTSATSAHLDLLESSLAIDQQFFTDYQSAKADATDTAIITLIIMAIILVIALLAVAATGGIALAVAGGGIIVILSSGEALALAAIVGCFAAWGVAHELLVHPFVITDTAPRTTTTTTPRTGPTPAPVPTPAPDPWPWDPWPFPLPDNRTQRDDCRKHIEAVLSVFPNVRPDVIGYLTCLQPEMTPQEVIDLFTYWTSHGMSEQDINNLIDRLRNLRLPANYNQPSRDQIIAFLRTRQNDIPDIWQKYQQIQNKPNADFILHDMIIGPDSKYRGSYFQLNWVVAHQSQVDRIEYFGADGRQGADALLTNGTLVDTKNYIWANQAFLLKIGQPQREIADQLNRYMTDPNFAGRPVTYVFNSDGGKIPASIEQVFAAARARGLNVTVTYWPNPNPPQIVP